MDTKTILIIDDEEPYRHLFSSEIAKEGFSVMEASGGRNGLAMALDKKPDLILLDLNMPEMDGMAVLEELRKDSWGKDAKVFILTNVSDNSKLAEAIEQKSFVYLVKSDMTINELITKIKQSVS